MNELNTYITPKELLYLDPRRQEEMGRPRGVDNEIKIHNETWGTVTRKDQNKQEWKTFIDALIVSRQERT